MEAHLAGKEFRLTFDQIEELMSSNPVLNKIWADGYEIANDDDDEDDDGDEEGDVDADEN